MTSILSEIRNPDSPDQHQCLGSNITVRLWKTTAAGTTLHFWYATVVGDIQDPRTCRLPKDTERQCCSPNVVSRPVPKQQGNQEPVEEALHLDGCCSPVDDLSIPLYNSTRESRRLDGAPKGCQATATTPHLKTVAVVYLLV